jgi:hypothetical protein
MPEQGDILVKGWDVGDHRRLGLRAVRRTFLLLDYSHLSITA